MDQSHVNSILYNNTCFVNYGVIDSSEQFKYLGGGKCLECLTLHFLQSLDRRDIFQRETILLLTNGRKRIKSSNLSCDRIYFLMKIRNSDIHIIEAAGLCDIGGLWGRLRCLRSAIGVADDPGDLLEVGVPDEHLPDLGGAGHHLGRVPRLHNEACAMVLVDDRPPDILSLCQSCSNLLNLNESLNKRRTLSKQSYLEILFVLVFIPVDAPLLAGGLGRLAWVSDGVERGAAVVRREPNMYNIDNVRMMVSILNYRAKIGERGCVPYLRHSTIISGVRCTLNISLASVARMVKGTSDLVLAGTPLPAKVRQPTALESSRLLILASERS